MNNLKNIFFIITITSILCGCTNNRSDVIGVREGKTIIADAAKASKTVEVTLSEWIADMEIIQLDDPSTESLVGSPGFDISDHYIGTKERQQPYKLFERKSGKYIGTIGHIGRGPGEYLNIYSSQIDEAANRVYILPWQCDNILAYDLRGGFVGPIPLAIHAPKGCFRVDSKINRVIVSIIPFEGGADKVVWQQDLEGNIIGGEDATLYALKPDFSNEVIRTGNTLDYDFSLLALTSVKNNGLSDYLYHYDPKNNKLFPVFLMDIKNLNIQGPTSVFYVELPNYYIGFASPWHFSNSAPPEQQPVLLFINKTDLTGGRLKLIDDFLGQEDVSIFSFREGYFIQSYDPVEFMDLLKKQEQKGKSKIANRIEKLLSEIKKDGNNVLIIGKLK